MRREEETLNNGMRALYQSPAAALAVLVKWLSSSAKSSTTGARALAAEARLIVFVP